MRHGLHIIHNDGGQIAQFPSSKKGERQSAQLIRQLHAQIVFFLSRSQIFLVIRDLISDKHEDHDEQKYAHIGQERDFFLLSLKIADHHLLTHPGKRNDRNQRRQLKQRKPYCRLYDCFRSFFT